MPTAAEIERLAVNAPLQEVGRFTERDLVRLVKQEQLVQEIHEQRPSIRSGRRHPNTFVGRGLSPAAIDLRPKDLRQPVCRRPGHSVSGVVRDVKRADAAA